MKKLLLLSGLIASIQLSAQMTFGLVEKHGFSHWPNAAVNADITDIKAFKGHLYVGSGSDSAYIYSSPSGDMATFSRVFSSFSYDFVGKFNATADNGGYLYAVARSGYFYQSAALRTDGVNWNYYFNSNMYEEVMNTIPFKGLQTFDSVYVAVRTSGGNNLLLRNSVDQNDPYNSLSTWDTVAATSSLFGTAGMINDAVVHNGALYYAMGDNTLFSTLDGRTVNYNTDFYNSIGYGGTSNVDFATSLESFGSYLYIGTRSMSGAQIWRTADGITFDSVGVLNPAMFEVQEMKTVAGKLYIVVKNWGNSFELYSTTDGVNFTLEDNTGLGVLGSHANNFSPIEEFNNHLYIGVSHDFGGSRLNGHNNTIQNSYTEGGKVLRACLTGALPTVTIVEPDTNIVCAGVSFTLNATGASNYLWSNANTGSSLSVNVPGHFGVTTVDGVTGCRNSDDAYIKNYLSALPRVLDTLWNLASVASVCSGYTSAPFMAVDPNNDFNCVVSSGANDGIVTPGGPAFYGSGFTIEAWILPQSSGVVASIYDPAGNWPYNDNQLIQIQSLNQLYINLENIGSAFVGYLIYNNWNHVVLRYDAASQYMDGFINGSQGGGTYTGTSFLPPSSSAYEDAFKFMNSSAYPYYDQGMKGKIRDIRIWNVARTNAEIIDNRYGLPASGSYPNLVFYYKTLETSGSIAADSSGNGNDAAVAGTFSSPTPVTWLTIPTMNVTGFNTAVFFPTVPTLYGMQYTDVHGCAVTDSFKVEPRAINVYGTPAASCGGNPAMIAYSYSSGFYNPTWTSPTLGSVGGYSITITPPSDEWVYATDTTGGCTVRDSILVKVGPAFVSGLGTEPPVYACENTDVVLHAMASGGTPPYTIYWTSSFYSDTTAVDSLVYNVGSSGANIYVSGMDNIGCSLQVGGFNGYYVSPIPSTDLTGHVTSIAPQDINDGYVYVFKHQPGNAGLDTIGYRSLDANGWYNFPLLTAGNYLIKTIPNEISFPNSVPTYYGNAFQWDSSVVYTHGCVQNDTASIVIVETDGTLGTASVSGYIIEGPGFGTNRFGNGGGPVIPFVPGGPLKGIDVKLGKNPGGGIQARTMSDTTGFYQFQNVPDGNYRIFVDIPNLPMDSTREISITAGDSSVQNNYFADSLTIYINNNVIGIHSSSRIYENKFSVYPNPAKSVLYLKYNLTDKSDVAFEMTDMMGEKIFSERERKYPLGENVFVLDIGKFNLSGGVYFISLVSGGQKFTQRIVVVE